MICNKDLSYNQFLSMFKKTANSHKVFLFSYSIKYAWYCQLIILILFSGSVFAQSFRQLTGDYLGQTPPGLEATLFAPGIVSTDSIEHSSPIFSPDRNMVLWTRIFSGKPAFIVEMTKENGKWSSPFIPEFVDVRLIIFTRPSLLMEKSFISVHADRCQLVIQKIKICGFG